MFFDSQSITVLTGSHQDCWENISEYLVAKSNPDYNKIKNKFLLETKNYNEESIQQMIKDAICRYSDSSDITLGLKKYCDKFGIDTKDFSSKNDIEIIRYIIDHKDIIDEVLKKHYL